MPSKTLLVAAIKNGTVIDHITAGHALKIIRILDLALYQKVVTVGLNLPSKLMGYKDLIKVEGRELTPEEANRVAILAPQATINIIKNYQVVKKFPVKMPGQVDKLLICPNPNCITNHEAMDSMFQIKLQGQEVKVRCHYCEKNFGLEEIKEYRL